MTETTAHTVVAVPVDLLRRLFAVYETVWHTIGTVDPGEDLARKGYAELISVEDSQLVDAVCEAVEPDEASIRLLLEEP